MASLPEIGVLGGDIFAVQQELRTLGTKPMVVPLPDLGDDSASGSDTDSEKSVAARRPPPPVAAAQYLLTRSFDVFRSFPGIGALPFGGIHHTGGVVPGPLGQERWAIVRSGEGVFTPTQMAAMGGGAAAQPVVLGPITIYEAEGRATVAVNDKEIEVAVERVLDKTAGRAQLPTAAPETGADGADHRRPGRALPRP